MKMFWSNAEKWVESDATAVVPSPHSQDWRAAKVALAITRATSRCLDGEVAAANIPQLLFTVRVVPGRHRTDSNVRPVSVDQQ